MILEDMRLEVKNLVQDASFDDDQIDTYINEAFALAASQVNLPDLKRIDVVSTVVGQSFTSLAAIQGGFNGRLSKVISQDIRVCNDLESLSDAVEMEDRDFGTEGLVQFMALEGRTVWYDPIPPTIMSFPVILYGNPPILLNDEDSPNVFIPESHRNIGIHGAAMIAYGFIEDGVDADKLNTNFHEKKFMQGVMQLQQHIARTRTHNITSKWSV